jgi:CelD/BcsL family acetyltransferase involved in cellulose biosynthesis
LITDLIITTESFESLAYYRSNPHSGLVWDLVFTLPAWLKVWWQSFGPGAELYIRSIKQNDNLLGIAPLQIRGDTASIIGSVNVCDYQDFITVPGKEKEFYNAVLDDLLKKRIKTLHLETIRPDSSIVNYLMPAAKERQYAVDYQQVDVSLDMPLPDNWEAYLATLDGKQRHEIRRKMRNLQASGETNYRVVQDKNEEPQATDTFMHLFPDYRKDKADFMTTDMQSYFRTLAGSLAEAGVLRYGVLEFGKQAVAMIMYFEYNENVYLYNSAYHPDYKSMSVGIVSKARCVQDSIEKRKKRFDFMKGNEQYKYYLGGKEIPLYRCLITLK